jgi:hypothetical protein
MTKPKDEHARRNELRRQKAAELIALQMRKQQRERTDEALLTAADARDVEAQVPAIVPQPPNKQAGS